MIVFSPPESLRSVAAPTGGDTRMGAAAAALVVVTPWSRQVLAALGEDGLGGGGIETGGTGGGASDLYSLLSDHGLWGAWGAYNSNTSASDYGNGALCVFADLVAPYSTGFADWLRSLCGSTGTGTTGGSSYTSMTSLLSDYPALQSLYGLQQNGATPDQAASTLVSWGTATSVCKAFWAIQSVVLTLATGGTLGPIFMEFYSFASSTCEAVGKIGEWVTGGDETPPPPPPEGCPDGPQPCAEGEKWDEWLCRCVPAEVGQGCGDNGIVDYDGNCVPCGEGFLYDPAAGGCVWQGDAAAAADEYSIDSFLADFPGLGGAYSAYAQGLSPADAVASLGDTVGTVCTIIVTIGAVGFAAITRGAGAAQAFKFWGWLTALCGVAGAIVTGVTGPDKPPGTTCDKPQEPCLPSFAWSPDFCKCIAENTGTACRNGMGFYDTTGNCLPCGPGQHFDEATGVCTEGCPQGMVPDAMYGCVDENYNKACDYDGQAGVVDPTGACVPDGCPKGQKFDWVTETCVPVGATKAVSVPVRTNVPPKGGTKTKPIEIKPDDKPALSSSSKTSWGLWLGLAMVVGAGALLLKSKQGEAGAANVGSSDEADGSDESGGAFVQNPLPDPSIDMTFLRAFQGRFAMARQTWQFEREIHVIRSKKTIDRRNFRTLTGERLPDGLPRGFLFFVSYSQNDPRPFYAFVTEEGDIMLPELSGRPAKLDAFKKVNLAPLARAMEAKASVDMYDPLNIDLRHR